MLVNRVCQRMAKEYPADFLGLQEMQGFSRISARLGRLSPRCQTDIVNEVLANGITWLMIRVGLKDSLTSLQATKAGDLDGTVWA